MTPREIYLELVVNSNVIQTNKLISDIELMFIIEGNKKAKELYKQFKTDAFHLSMRHATKLKELLYEIKTQGNICSALNQSQNP